MKFRKTSLIGLLAMTPLTLLFSVYGQQEEPEVPPPATPAADAAPADAAPADAAPADAAPADAAPADAVGEDPPAVPVPAVEDEGPDLDGIVPQPDENSLVLPGGEEPEGVDLGELPPETEVLPVAQSGPARKSFVVSRNELDQEVPLVGINLVKDRRTFISQGKEEEFLPRITPVAGIVAFTGTGGGDLKEPPAFEDLKDKLASEFLGKPLTFGGLEEVVKRIQGHYLGQGRMLTHVYVPNQVMTDKLVIAIVEGAVSSLDAEAVIPDGRSWWDRWYDQPYRLEDLKDEVLQELGGLDALEPQNLNEVLVNLNLSPWSRLERPIQHPFRQVNAKYAPASQEGRLLLGKTDVTLLVGQERPLKFFAGMDNTLPQNLGEERFYAGAVWYDAFALNLDHQLALQFFYGLESDSLEGLALSYIIPWKMWDKKHVTELYFAYTQSSSPTFLGGVDADVTGDSTIAGFRHYYELPPLVEGGEIVRPEDDQEKLLQTEPDSRLPWMSARRVNRQRFGIFHEVGAGLDFKSTNNNLEFGGLEVAPAQADILQFVIEYNARQTDESGETNLSWKNYLNIGGSGDAELEALRAEAESSYYYTRVDLDREQDLPWGTYARARLTGQYASTNLIPSEQLGVGGFSSVRGYPERIFRADSGWLFSLEYYSPAFQPLARSWPSLGWRDQLRFLVFTDWGGGGPNEDNTTDPFDDSSVLGSVGLGLRYDVGDNFRLRLDYGFQLSSLDDAFDDEASDNQLHFGIVATF